MAKELVILAWCDPCQDQDIKTEGQTYTLGIDGKTLTIELCEKHAKPVLTVRDLLLEYGQKPESPGSAAALANHHPRGRGPRVSDSQRKLPYKPRQNPDDLPEAERLYCLLCERYFGHTTGLQGHYERAHGITATLGEIYGTQCFECGETAANFRHLSVHMRTTHDITHAAKVVHSSLDRFGIIAERRKWAEEAAMTLV